MKNSLCLISVFLVVSLIFISCKKDTVEIPTKSLIPKTPEDWSKIPFDSTLVHSFFMKYPKLQAYESDVKALYRKHQFHYIWYDRKGINQLANLLYDKINTIANEGVKTTIPYKGTLTALFQNDTTSKPSVTKELLISSSYFFYADKVFYGLNVKKRQELGWYLPKKKLSYVDYLDSLIVHPTLIDKDEKEVLGQYYRLKSMLKKYREIKKTALWDSIPFNPEMEPIALGDSLETVSKIRQHLFALGVIKEDSKSNIYDKEMAQGVLNYKKSMGLVASNMISSKMIKTLNVPIASRIQTIKINMERCRWVSNDITKTKEYIVVNIPSYQLTYFKEGKPVLRSNVVVGKVMHETVVFSGMMQFIVFSPYWNVTPNIIKTEIAPEMKKNKNYLAEHDMEWNGGRIRQKPGPKNSLGLVKFLFPNSNNIYLHDSPAKSLFNASSRAFSHGCIRVAKPVELANEILKGDTNWTPEKITEAMHSGKESWYTLKEKIPVYIGYFTAWVDDDDVIHFYDDVYKRDGRLAEQIFEK